MSDFRMTEQLLVFRVEDSETHWVIARNEDDAWIVFNDCEMNQDEEPRASFEIVQLADNAIIVVRDDDGPRLSFRAREWAALEGRGFLCSTVF